jgi:hypothetical protein
MQIGEPNQITPGPAGKTWIAIALVDEHGKPVPREPYRIELPDGSVLEGRLDAKGRARQQGIDPGTCKISFPQLEAAWWEPA